MFAHTLFFNNTPWTGKGSIFITMSNEEINFCARWIPNKIEDTLIKFTQEVEINDMMEKMENCISFKNFSDDKFEVELENNVWGHVKGNGIMNDKTISWEFKDREANIEGFEIYEKVSDTKYLLRAEYMSSDHHRTHIQGELCLENPQE